MDRLKLKAIIEHFGAYAQVSKAIEELIELSEVLIKDLNKSELAMDDLYEEMADVEIMLEQLKIIYNLNDAVLENYKDRKMERTIGRINKEHGYFNEDDKPIYQTDCAWK